jgi:hypothetical protein
LEALIQRDARIKPNSVLPASPMKHRNRRLNFAGILKIRNADTAPQITSAVPDTAASPVNRLKIQRAMSALNAMAPARPSMPSSMLNAFMAPTIARHVNATLPNCVNSRTEFPNGLPSVVTVRSGDVPSTSTAATRCAVRRATGEISNRSSSRPTSTTSADAESNDTERNWLGGRRPMPNMHPTNIATPPTTGTSPWCVLRPPGLSTSSTATAKGRRAESASNVAKKHAVPAMNWLIKGNPLSRTRSLGDRSTSSKPAAVYSIGCQTLNSGLLSILDGPSVAADHICSTGYLFLCHVAPISARHCERIVTRP